MSSRSDYTNEYNAFGVIVPSPMVDEVLENKNGIDNPVTDLDISNPLNDIFTTSNSLGQTFPLVTPAVGVPYGIIPAPYSKNVGLVSYWSAGFNFYGSGDSSTSAASSTFSVPTSASLLSSTLRHIVTSAASAGSSASDRQNSKIFWIGNATGTGGFLFITRFAFETIAANQRFFVGMQASSSAIGNVQPSSIVNMFGFGADAGETSISFMNNDASGTATKTSLGSLYPAQTAGAYYEARIFCPPNGAAIYYSLERLDVPGLVIQNRVSTGIPSNTTFLTWHLWVNNGSTASAVAMSNAFVYTEI